MNKKKHTIEILKGIPLILALASSVLAFNGGVRASEPGVNESQDAGTDWWQQRQERRRARQREHVERTRGVKSEAVPAVVARPPALADIKVSFRLDPRLTRGLYMGDLWVSPPTYSGVQAWTFTVEARVQGRDANRQPMDISPRWIPADPKMVTVSPSEGNEVTITVRRAGESSLRVAASETVSRELSIKAWYQGEAMQAEISQEP